MKKPKIAKTIDVRKLLCISPDMDTLRCLELMVRGQILEVICDHPLALQRLPRNLIRKGHKLLSIERIEGPTHRLFIEAFGLT
jgi:TusA-related sulfurtransferase